MLRVSLENSLQEPCIESYTYIVVTTLVLQLKKIVLHALQVLIKPF